MFNTLAFSYRLAVRDPDHLHLVNTLAPTAWDAPSTTDPSHLQCTVVTLLTVVATDPTLLPCHTLEDMGTHEDMTGTARCLLVFLVLILLQILTRTPKGQVTTTIPTPKIFSSSLPHGRARQGKGPWLLSPSRNASRPLSFSWERISLNLFVFVLQ